MVKRKTRKKKYIKIGNLKIKKSIAIIVVCAVVVVVAFVIFRTSDYWPWPSQSEVDQRLIDVVDACMYNESSRACKNLQSRYSMSFEYCYALSDIPEIDTLMPVYGVAKKKGFVGLPLNWESRNRPAGISPDASSLENNLKTMKKNSSVYPYYGCTRTLDEIRTQKGDSLIDNPDTIALFGLSKIPQYYESYEPHGQYGCTFHRPSINYLWEQIPNISVVRDEADRIFNMYPKCSMRADIDRSINDLNARISNYANNYSVQLFYQKYDEWNKSDSYSCTWYDKEFKQLCGAASDGTSNDSMHDKTMLKDFISEMREYLHTDHFTSKIVVTN